MRQKIASKARDEMTKEQREYMLRQQLRAIQQELGEKDSDKAEVEMLRERFKKAELPEEAKKEVERELGRLERLPAGAPDYHVTRTYLEFVLDLPWNTSTEDNLDIAHAREVLDKDHFGLKEVKERILEHLSVLKRNPEAKAPIFAWWALQAWARRRSANRSHERWDASSSGSAWAACTMKPSCAVTGEPISARWPGRLLQAMRRAGAHESGAAARRSGQAGPRFPWRSGRGIARGARSGAEQDVPR